MDSVCAKVMALVAQQALASQEPAPPPAPSVVVAAVAAAEPVRVADEIQKLFELKEKGALTQEEFDQQKAAVLAA